MTVLRGRQSLLGLLLTTLAIGTACAATATRTSSFEYDPATGLLTREIIEPDSPQLRLETTYAYDDAYGNKTSATVSSPATGMAAIAARTSTVTFDGRGQFPVSNTNALGHTETKVIDPKFGNITSLTGPNGLSTRWQYDDFGRKIREIRADGNQTKWDYLYCKGVAGGTTPCPSLARYMIQTTPLAGDGVTANGAWSRVFFDALNREIRTETQGFDGASIIRKDTEYDSLGRAYRTSDPYYADRQTPQWTTVSYDALSRVIAITAPDNSQTTTAYNGLSITSTNALGQSNTRINNSQGKLARVIDAQNNALNYEYDPFGNLTKTIDPLGNTITLTYDTRGRKTQMIDPDMGTWKYDYNVLGELVRQTDAKNQVVTMLYDKLGRMTRRAEPDLISTWTFDNCTKGIGKPCTATTDNGYARSHGYDSLGRAESTATTIDATYTASVSYDTNGRVATQTYPTGLAVKYAYTSLGYLKEVRNHQSDALYWRGDTMDAKGHLLQQTYGNGVITQQVYEERTGHIKQIYAGAGNGVQHLSFTHDQIGNMLSRSDANQNLNETFLYDSLNRLTSATVNSGGAGVVTQSFGYNAIGNIVSRSDVGSYTYGAVNHRPHAVQEIALAQGGKRQYTYDANGSLTEEVQLDANNQVIASKGRTEVYTSFGMPQALGAPGISLAFAYGPEHQRVKQIAPSATTIYLHPDNAGGLSYEKDIKPNGSIEHKHYITAAGQVIALVKQSGSTTTTRYFHRDHLGSTTAMTDEAGAVVERLAYEAFGKRRFANGAMDPDNTIVGVETDRGYTNHEHLDELGLIHMNGRIYDPVIGRFMSADPVLEAPGNLQSYNRYSYVMNNPLNTTDPSGYFSFRKLFKAMGRQVVADGTGVFHYQMKRNFQFVMAQPGQRQADNVIMKNPALYAIGQAVVTYYGGPYGAAMWASYYSYQGTGSMTQAYRAGAKAFASSYASAYVNDYYGSAWNMERVLVTSTVGGASAGLHGGKFADGFKFSFGMSMLSWANYSMRQDMITQSKLDPLNDGTGGSRGLFRDGFKLGGGRWNPSSEMADIVQCSSLGCLQSGPGSVFGFGYGKGGLIDLVVESFAGPHDMANSPWFYDANGLIKDLAGKPIFALELATNYTTSLIFAAPFAAGALAVELGVMTNPNHGNRFREWR
jgi:RHS repeat-associated protein